VDESYPSELASTTSLDITHKLQSCLINVLLQDEGASLPEKSKTQGEPNALRPPLHDVYLTIKSKCKAKHQVRFTTSG